MKLKAILTFLAFFIGTPLILGQSGLPTSLPSIPQSPLSGLPSDAVSSIPDLPQTPAIPNLPQSIPVDSLAESGIDPSSITSLTSDPSQRARDAAALLGHEGILNHTPSGIPTTLPTDQDPTSLGKQFVERTFPKEFNAVQGKINDIPTQTPDLSSLTSTPALPSVPTSIPSVPTSIPSTLPSISTPSLPSLPSL